MRRKGGPCEGWGSCHKGRAKAVTPEQRLGRNTPLCFTEKLVPEEMEAWREGAVHDWVSPWAEEREGDWGQAVAEPTCFAFVPHTPDRDGEKPEKPMAPPRLGQLTATDITSSSLLLRWTVPEGEFDSFVIQYKDRDQPQVVPVEGPQRSALISNLEVGRKYKFVLYGLVGKKRHGPLVAEAKISE